ncbi:hypothetical protein [Brevibacterium moorei]|uniref:hypothetical protein n=1 Tax=Brevibacterium moorei TaxID=2968457 RepID=UPI00211B8CB0|nr:hypothetical protein [Brevibacterium sp. 68QC2CO]MCQ9385086.1 hypothetical protein [Brevibacterium sp. 68QC2CO]
MADGKIVITLKAGKGYEAPWLVVSGDTPIEAQTTLQAVIENGLPALVGQASQAFQGMEAAGANLGATPVQAPGNQPQQGSQWAQTPAPQVQQQQQSMGQAAWPQPPQQQGNPFGQQVQQQGGFQQPQQGAGAFGGEEPPMTPFGPARKVTGTSKYGPYAAWADPRPREQTQHLGREASTKDPQDPGLLNGTKKFWLMIK